MPALDTPKAGPAPDAQGQTALRRAGAAQVMATAIPSLEGKLIKIFLGVSFAVHVFVIAWEGFKFAPRQVTLDDETEIAADLMQDFEMTAPTKTALPDAAKAPEAAAMKDMLPQSIKNMQIAEPKKLEEPEADEKIEKKEVEAKVAPVEKKAEPAPPTPQDLERIELDKRDAMKRLALDALRQQNKVEKQVQAPEKDPLAKLAEQMEKSGKFNKGPGRAINGAHAAKYIALLREAIRSNYNLPEVYNLKGAGIKVMLAIEINDQGQVSSLAVQESSGDPAFDSLTMEAVRSSVPLPKPPPDLVGQTFLLNMTPRGG